jgi:phospholipid transport system substrate-binding protein
MSHKKPVFYFVGLFFLWLSCVAVAKGGVIKPVFDSTPHNVIQDTTELVLDALAGGLTPTEQPEVFVEEFSKILDPIIAFDYIASGVMGKYTKQATPEQTSQFSRSFKLGLINTYGSGMSNFSDLTIVVLPPKKKISDKDRRIVVVQEITGGTNTNQVIYSMAKNNQGEWKMINIILNGINLGQTFRGQFAAQVEKNKGDLSKTIDEWGLTAAPLISNQTYPF